MKPNSLLRGGTGEFLKVPQDWGASPFRCRNWRGFTAAASSGCLEAIGQYLGFLNLGAIGLPLCF
ncbi:MAG: hypothetical protein ACRDEA_15710 [Microcystaceae cyanobacterium]